MNIYQKISDFARKYEPNAFRIFKINVSFSNAREADCLENYYDGLASRIAEVMPFFKLIFT